MGSDSTREKNYDVTYLQESIEGFLPEDVNNDQLEENEMNKFKKNGKQLSKHPKTENLLTLKEAKKLKSFGLNT